MLILFMQQFHFCNVSAKISGQAYKQPTVCESIHGAKTLFFPVSFRRCLTLSCVVTVCDAVESVLAVGYICEEVRQSLRSGSTEEGHLAYTSVPAQQSSDTITAAGPIPFIIN